MMNQFQYIPIFALMFAVASANPTKTSEESEVLDRIHADEHEIHGMKANYGDRPFQVFVTNKWGSSLCGGALIEWNWVLTAGHCVNGEGATIPDGRDIVIKAGIINRVHDAALQKQTVQKQKVHWGPGWNGGLVSPDTNDLLLLKLDRPFVSNGGKAGLVKLYNKSADTINSGEQITISGWGVTSQLGGTTVYTDDLLVSTVHLTRVLYDNEFLELSDDEGNVSCGGDSGGPATKGEELVGILHGGSGTCGSDTKRSFYTSVYKYKDWICNTVDDKNNIAEFCNEGTGGNSGGNGGNSGGECADREDIPCQQFAQYCQYDKVTINDENLHTICPKTCGKCENTWEEDMDMHCLSHLGHQSVSNQKECQESCEANDACVGISFQYRGTVSHWCYLCTTDKLMYTDVGYAFYRKPTEEEPDCENTWTNGDCNQFTWACTDDRYPWFKDECKKTCNNCSA